jgi:hypothetical protein
MFKKFFLSTVFTIFAFNLFCTNLYAQGASAASASSSGGEKDDEFFDAKEAFGTILVSGLVGGILGLSTLSFYEKPNDHVKNITYGAGLAMIGAALYMTLNIANQQNEKDKEKKAFLDHQDWMLSPTYDFKTVGLSLNYNF